MTYAFRHLTPDPRPAPVARPFPYEVRTVVNGTTCITYHASARLAERERDYQRKHGRDARVVPGGATIVAVG